MSPGPTDRPGAGGGRPEAVPAGTLPPGTLPVGLGLVVTGVTAYGYLLLTARVLGPARYATLSVLWALVFLTGPGLFLPLQQEVGRLLAHRRVEGTGGGPVVRRAALCGAGLAGVVLLALGACAVPIVRHLFDGQALLLVGLALALVGYLLLSLVWGTLSGGGRFRSYALAQVSDGSLRLGICIVLALAGVHAAGPYGLVLGLTPGVAALIAMRGNRDLLAPGPDAPLADLSAALGWLLVGSLGAQMLANASVIAVKVLATGAEQARAGHFLAGLVIARVPLFLFGAVQAALLPRLAGLARQGRYDELRVGLVRLLALVALIALAATALCFLVGPEALRLLFGHRFALGRGDLTILAAGSGAYMLALAVAQAIIALGLHARSAVCWMVGIVVLVVVTAIGTSLLPRVEYGFLAGAIAALVTASALLWPRLRGIEHALDPDELMVPSVELEFEP
jgi:O-antigen/teichoic acid export membrane protein